MPVIPAALVVVVVGGYFLFRRADVRLVLMLAAAAMFFVRATQPQVAGARLNAFAQFFTEFAKGLTSLSSVVPICSAMGFAYVCKLTECDAHLVHLLCRPLRHVRWLLIPGGIAVAFLVNSAIVSQTSTVSVVGPVLIPLLIGAGVSRQTAGSLLLLGGSMGGELFNPAAIEVTTISKVTSVAGDQIIRRIMPYNLLASGTALLVFWLLAVRYEKRLRSTPGFVEEDTVAYSAGSIAASMANMSNTTPLERINPFKAAVPLIPILLLMILKPIASRHGYMPDISEQAAIAAAMLIGLVCAVFTAPRRVSSVAAAFFEGAGFAFSHVISVIVAASMFAESINANGLIRMMAEAVQLHPSLVIGSSVVIPWLLASITGTAVGTAPLVIGILLPVAMKTVNASIAVEHGVRVGGLNAIAAQFGRTSSPVAPVVIMCATLAHARPIALVRRVVIPLAAGGVVLFLAAMLRSG